MTPKQLCNETFRSGYRETQGYDGYPCEIDTFVGVDMTLPVRVIFPHYILFIPKAQTTALHESWRACLPSVKNGGFKTNLRS